MAAIFRIMPSLPRSARAIASHAGLPIRDLPAVPPEGDDLRAREIACSLAHAGALHAFLTTAESFGVVLEDDAILCTDRTWFDFRQFDFFLPYADNRKSLPPDSTIHEGVLPRFGAFAYLCSRTFTERLLPRLHAGEIADHASHRAAAGQRVASIAGNLVNHANLSVSHISEARRLFHLRQGSPS